MKKIMVWINRGFLTAAMLFAGWFLIKQYDSIRKILVTADISGLVLSFSILVLFVIIQAFLGASVLRTVGGGAPYRITLPIILTSLLGKYIPGKIWVVTMRLTSLSRHRISAATVIASSVIEHVFAISTGLLVFLLSSSDLDFSLRTLPTTVAVTIFILFILLPEKVHTLVNRILGILRHEPLPTWPSRGRSFGYTACYTANWLILGFGIYILAGSLIPELGSLDVVTVSGFYALSVIAGFFAVFAPGGIGVREGIFVLALHPYTSAMNAVFVALTIRLVLSIAELTAIGTVATLAKPKGLSFDPAVD